MSKKKQAYEHGLEQIMNFLEYSFETNRHPSAQEILNEAASYDGLKNIPFELMMSDDHPVHDDTPFFYMLQEEYRRHDSLLPEFVQLWKLPAEQVAPKEIYKLIRLQPVIW